jgi:hypothetical protein
MNNGHSLIGLVNQNIHNNLNMIIIFACIVIVENLCKQALLSSSLCVRNRSLQSPYFGGQGPKRGYAQLALQTLKPWNAVLSFISGTDIERVLVNTRISDILYSNIHLGSDQAQAPARRNFISRISSFKTSDKTNSRTVSKNSTHLHASLKSPISHGGSFKYLKSRFDLPKYSATWQSIRLPLMRSL